MQSPTVSGGFASGSIGGIASQVVRVDTIKDVDANPPISSGSDVGTPNDAVGVLSILGIKFDFGLLPVLDVFYENGSEGVRVQFLGDQTHGLVGTISAAYDGFVTSDPDNSAFGTSSKTKGNAFDGGISLGYAVDERTIPYFSYGHRVIWAKTEVQQTSNSYDYHQTGNEDIFALGFQRKSGHLDFQVEAGMNVTYWPGANSYNDAFLAASLAYRWGENIGSGLKK